MRVAKEPPPFKFDGKNYKYIVRLQSSYYYWGGSMKVKIKLYEIRIAKKLSQRKLAEMAGVSKTEIFNIENGVTSPSIDTLCLLAQALEVDFLCTD